QHAGPLDLGGRVRERMRDALERADRAAELDALARIMRGDLERFSGQARERGGHQDLPLLARGREEPARRLSRRQLGPLRDLAPVREGARTGICQRAAARLALRREQYQVVSVERE